jgi:hypothetical protein
MRKYLRSLKNFIILKCTYYKIFFFPLSPISNFFGFDRGVSIDRFYINNFIKKNKRYIKGNVLEIGDDRYSSKYNCKKIIAGIVKKKRGGAGCNIFYLNLEKKLPNSIGTFDCIICTQVLNYVFDYQAVIENLFKLLNKNGVLLLTCSSTTRISEYDDRRYGDYWRFTRRSIYKIFNKYSKKNNLQIQSYGNVSVVSKFLYGLSLEELTNLELSYNDKNFPLIITARLKK